nr:immunoglobulin heavy chain junction region [Mus musculus]MBK4196910.1 immunoglobulin heavy chain junction region [Mus musculus]MBK4196911.1 immunoglobulin heavy chain junction region [Mus musculus]MBK4196912.1 immunoglobulin heavy chain junction region [Mus musculus]
CARTSYFSNPYAMDYW